MMRWIAALTLLVAISPLPALAAEPESAVTPIGRHVENFELDDHRGHRYSLDDFSDCDVVVIAVLGIECPLVRVYAPRLAELAERYESQGVAFVGINPNRQDSITELGYFVRRNGIEFPVLKDVGNKIADQLGAVRVPEMFVLDRDRVIRYWGRIDDQYGFQKGVGYQKPAAVRSDLGEAIDELLAGKSVSVPVTPSPGCHIGRVREVVADSDVTYSNQIARIFQDRCVECHRENQIAPFAMEDYDEVVGWAEMIKEVVSENRMPPWHADPKYGEWINDCRLTEDEKQTIYTWVKNGAPEGDPSELPQPRVFIEGWQLPREPDLVIAMADEPFTVPADGTVEYQYFTVDPGFEEDVYVTGAECLAGNRAVVHHIIVYIKPPGNGGIMPEGVPGGQLLAGTAPGNPATVLPEGMAIRVPAHSKLIFEMHYTAIGSEQDDCSSIGLLLADESEVKQKVLTSMAINTQFLVPAGASNHRVEATRKFRKDGLLVSLMPHMHLRGAAFSYELHYPDGSREMLLDIPHYDFNWQNSYYFAEPKFVPKGSKMVCVAHFDNSEDNLANPDSTSPVGWGLQTWEEMMIGWYVWAPLDKDQQSDVAQLK